MQQGFSLPILPILILLISVLTYFCGWVVLAISAGLFICIPVVTVIYDKLTHGSNCIECNTIKQAISDKMGVEIGIVKTKHEKMFDDHMHIRADIGKEKSFLLTNGKGISPIRTIPTRELISFGVPSPSK